MQRALSNLTVIAKDIATGNILPDFKFIVNEDNVGDPQIELPESSRDPSKFPSMKPANSHSQIVATGEAALSNSPVAAVPDGKYLVSVLAPGYKLGGNWITVAGTDVTVYVELQPHPLPLSKIRVHVFHDNNPVNGEDDFPLEVGLENFLVIIDDTIGEVTVDYFGNPLGTKYVLDQNGNMMLDPFGNPIPVPGTGGKVLTNANGNAVIENLPPGKYEVQAIPPDGTDWVQTTTIEGTHVIDVWIEEGNDGYSTEEGFKSALVWFGFIKPMEFGPPIPWVTGTIQGRVRTIKEFVPPAQPLLLGDPVDRPWISLCDIGGNDQQVYAGRGDTNGYFTINNVPPGIYQMAIWDEPLDHIISFRTVRLSPGQTATMGEIGIPRWYGQIQGNVFNDFNGNGARDPGETGIPDVEISTRFKDGSIQYSTVTDMHGNYSLDEVFELEHFTFAEVGFTRFARTGATAISESGLSETHPDVLTLAEMTWAGAVNRIDWGKKPYAIGENGGISGIVYYATMRNESDPRYAVAEDYEPGVPNVIVNLYAATINSLTGEITQGALLNTANTDAWEHPSGCLDLNGSPIPCLEVPATANQIRPGVFDGGYAFEPLSAGAYVVEVVPPAGYKILDENSVNTGEGDVFIGSGPAQAANASLARMAPPQYYPISTPPYFDPTKKVIILGGELNAAADFFIYTDVPIPGRIWGNLLDDLNLESNPASIYFGEKRGIPNTPIGIRDFTGRVITTVHTDANGVFEVLLPSTYTRNIPTPSGVAPGMYRVIGNDPGDTDRPNANYNPDYQTLNLVFDVWPGKTTYADVAIFPVTPFVAVPGSQFTQPPQCGSQPGMPEIFRVDRVHVGPSGSRSITITGGNFGSAPGQVTLDQMLATITSWSQTSITIDVPAIPGGPKQLMLSRADGKSSITRITIHVLDGSYNPTILNVPSITNPTIQSAINNAENGDLIVVSPGIYYESPIIYKNVKLQGMGAHDTVIDGRFFRSYENDWLATLSGINFAGPELVPPTHVKDISKGQVITIVAELNNFSQTFRTQLDGFTITGGRGKEAGGVFVNAHCHHLIISNNSIRSNGGGFGGGITLGKAYVGDNYNSNLSIHHNSIVNNGGISLAGGIGIFNGAANYEIDHNEICGNYSAEYGGGISHFGLSDGGKIHHNCVVFNSSFDEGGGILVGGEQPVPPAALSSGSGKVDIYNNLIKGNIANDDGGGLRLLQPLDYLINIYNNFIVNNVSTDIGGGIALDDASNVVICNNTIAKNITTATAEDSDGLAHAAGLASEPNSTAFMATLPPGSPPFSNPVLFNNIFWDNRAGSYDQDLNGGNGGIAGIGAAGDPHPVNVMDLEVFGMTALLSPEYCSLTQSYPAGSNNQVGNPLFVQEYDTQLMVTSFNGQPDFKIVRIAMTTPYPEGDYHLTINSTLVIDQGTLQVTRTANSVPITYQAPPEDFDGDARPRGSACDPGADEL